MPANAHAVTAAVATLRGLGAAVLSGAIRMDGGRPAADYVREIVEAPAAWAEKVLDQGDVARAALSVGWGLARLRNDLGPGGELAPPSDGRHAAAAEAAIAAVNYEPDSTLVAVAPDGKAYLVGWRGDAVRYEVDAMGLHADDVRHPRLPKAPGLYRWDGRIDVLGDGYESDFDTRWSGRARAAVAADLPEFGLAPMGEGQAASHAEGEVAVLIAVAANGTAIIVGWDAAVVGQEAKEVTHYAEDEGIPGIPVGPGLYRWDGTVTFPEPGEEGFDVRWSGSARPASVADVVALGLAFDGHEPLPPAAGADEPAPAAVVLA